MIHKLLTYTRQHQPIYIQTHICPDHDAVASAFALQHIFTKRVSQRICSMTAKYSGTP